MNSAQRDKTLLDRLAAEGTRLIEADDWRPDERLLEGWDHHPGDSGLTRQQVLDASWAASHDLSSGRSVDLITSTSQLLEAVMLKKVLDRQPGVRAVRAEKVASSPGAPPRK